MESEELARLRRENASLKIQAEVADRYASRYRSALSEILMLDDKSPQGLIAEAALSPG